MGVVAPGEKKKGQLIKNIHTSSDTFDGAWPKEYGRAALTKLSGTQSTMSYGISTYLKDPARYLIPVYFSKPPMTYQSLKRVLSFRSAILVRSIINPFQPRDAIWHHAFHLFLICMPFAHWLQ